jgi:hypothetical protein
MLTSHILQNPSLRKSLNNDNRVCNIEVKFAYKDNIGGIHDAANFLLYFSTG